MADVILRLDISKLAIDANHVAFSDGVACVQAYWAYALDLTRGERDSMRRLIADRHYQHTAESRQSFTEHPIYKGSHGKQRHGLILLRALYKNMPPEYENNVVVRYGPIPRRDRTADYLNYFPDTMQPAVFDMDTDGARQYKERFPLLKVIPSVFRKLPASERGRIRMSHRTSAVVAPAREESISPPPPYAPIGEPAVQTTQDVAQTYAASNTTQAVAQTQAASNTNQNAAQAHAASNSTQAVVEQVNSPTTGIQAVAQAQAAWNTNQNAAQQETPNATRTVAGAGAAQTARPFDYGGVQAIEVIDSESEEDFPSALEHREPAQTALSAAQVIEMYGYGPATTVTTDAMIPATTATAPTHGQRRTWNEAFDRETLGVHTALNNQNALPQASTRQDLFISLLQPRQQPSGSNQVQNPVNLLEPPLAATTGGDSPVTREEFDQLRAEVTTLKSELTTMKSQMTTLAENVYMLRVAFQRQRERRQEQRREQRQE
ncbi:hypothetical protein T069G_02672 [Trichoderma breve]|uniref:Uncharacterized protein n=1 Tax=Trichoderma breve TaxID=2034170 RepID=A0A9W9BKU2_9HYPO|nr:hypothetical protein T069G_02672 [Trichoderma breve]KAJ4861718.1 hypothetical protein T069G_02672 [Trichoderma breve]